MPRPQDHFGIKAKGMGYPARSVFKLKEILEKFRIFRPGSKVLDVGAAPGSFSQFLLERLQGKGALVAVDLAAQVQVPEHYANFTYIAGDIYDTGIREKIIGLGPYDLIVSDAAPATTGQKEVDAMKSIGLAECVFELATATLKKGGNMVVKIFQGGGEQEYLATLRGAFESVKGFKPQASRSESFETYYVGIGLKKALSTN